MARGEVPRITDAPVPHAEDVKRRMIRYSVQMGIRLACLVVGLVVHGWPRWVFFVAAVVLPYIAVIGANAGRERDEASDAIVSGPTPEALPPGGATPPEEQA